MDASDVGTRTAGRGTGSGTCATRWGMSLLAALLGSLCLVQIAGPAQAVPPVAIGGPASVQSQQNEQIRALIVGYERGYAPRPGRVLGASRVTGAQRNNLVLGSALGGRMWRVDFRTPVDAATAARVARQLATHPAVKFAELDRKVTAF